MKKLSMLLIAMLLLAGCGGTPAEEGNIKIGFISPLSGPTADFGTVIQNVVEVQVEKINTQGGVNGRMIEVIYEDGQCAPAYAAKAAQKLINIDKVEIILGGGCSSETMSTAPIAEAAGVLMLSPGSSNADISDLGNFIFRTVPSDASQSQILADYIGRYAKVGMLAEQTDYAVGVADDFEELYSGETVRKNYLSSEVDFKTILTSLTGSDIEALVLVPQSSSTLNIILRQLKELNWSKPIIADELAEGSIDFLRDNADFYADNLIFTKFAAPDNDSFQKAMADYEERYGESMTYPNYGASALDAVEAIYRSLLAVGNDAEAIRDYLYTHSFQSEAGREVSFDANGDVVGITHELFIFDGAEIVSYSS